MMNGMRTLVQEYFISCAIFSLQAIQNMDHYKLLLSKDRGRETRAVTVLILFINLLAFAFFLISGSMNVFNIAGLVVTTTGLFLLFTRISKLVSLFPIIFILLSIVWGISSNYLLTLLHLVFAFSGLLMNQAPWIIVSGEGIIYPSFPKKQIEWKDVSNVILKDGLITIDLNNNALIQNLVDRKVPEDFNEMEFNDFCLKKILAAQDN